MLAIDDKALWQTGTVEVGYKVFKFRSYGSMGIEAHGRGRDQFWKTYDKVLWEQVQKQWKSG